MANVRYALVWARRLFKWKAKQVAELDDDTLIAAMMPCASAPPGVLSIASDVETGRVPVAVIADEGTASPFRFLACRFQRVAECCYCGDHTARGGENLI